jgi:hypothetical protein
MKKEFVFVAVMIMTAVYGSSSEEKQVIPIDKSKFVIFEEGKQQIVDLMGEDYIVVSLRNEEADGMVYAVDGDGVLWWTDAISSGAIGNDTPEGIFTIWRKDRVYMSKAHPDGDGVNNMDFALWFTHQGHAIHLGNNDVKSYGCVHVGRLTAKTLFAWVKRGKTRVVITGKHYLPFVYDDWKKAGYGLTSQTPPHIEAYLQTLVPIVPKIPK